MISKRLLDFAGAASALLLLSPVLAAVALAIRLFLGRPVLFRQERPGYLEKPFTIHKFRTMLDAADSQGNLLPDRLRLTRFGSMLRQTSLDELPELWNVLKGDMSLVGPRPLLPAYLPRYTAFQRRRHEVKPGMTGWAQIHGRNAVAWEQKFAMDVWYVDNRSFWLDVKILWMTIIKVSRREGITHKGHASMAEFLGSDKQTAEPCQAYSYEGVQSNHMEHTQFLKLIDELLELDPGTLKGHEELEGVGWSSLAIIGFMALADEQFELAVSPKSIAQCRTPNDLAGLLGDRICAPQPA